MDIYRSLPFKWNLSVNQLEVKPSRSLNIIKWRYLAFLVYYVITIYQCVVAWSGLHIVTKAIASFAIAANMTGSFLYFVNVKYRKLICSLVNSMTLYEKATQTVTTSRQMKEYLKCLATNVFGPIPYYMIIFVSPCLPMFIGYWKFSECSGVSESGSVLNVLSQATSAFYAVASITVICDNMTMQFVFMVYFGYALSEYLKHYFR